MKKTLFFYFILTLSSFAQISKSGDLQSHIDSIITNMPQALDGDQYQHPTAGNMTTWASIIDNILSTDYSTAHTTAQTIGYRVTEFTDTHPNPDKVYYMLQNNPDGTNYWGTYIFDPAPDRAQLVIQSPHAIEDFNTGKQGFYVFREVGARAFFMNGTSRCNSSDTTLCDGSTTICTGSSEAYRISDQAHTSDGSFQEATNRMFINNSNLIFIQLHGFTKQASDPYVIMSNGISSDTPPTDHLATLKTNLTAEDNTLTFKIAHTDNWTRLIGSTNTQGRLINGSGDPCEDAANDNSGQFLHIEQEKTKLRDDASDWTKMSNAIAATFAEQALPVELVSFTAIQVDEGILLEWITATEVNNYGFEIERSLVISNEERNLEWEKIGFVTGHGNSNSPKSYSCLDEDYDKDQELRLKYRLKQIDTDGSFTYYSTIAEVNYSVTGVENSATAGPTEYRLSQNFPNPFNPSTTIEFSIKHSSFTTLKVYDILGNEVATLVNANKTPGNYIVSFDANKLSSGLYIYKLATGQQTITKKMLLLK
jgi:hypothetical protein